MGRYKVLGVHPESDDEWFEPESFDTLEAAEKYMNSLPQIDFGHGYHCLWDCLTNQRVDLPTSYQTLLEMEAITYTKHEKQSGRDRQHHAEGLISQLPATHDGRNTWLINYGRSQESDALRAKWIYNNGGTGKFIWNEETLHWDYER